MAERKPDTHVRGVAGWFEVRHDDAVRGDAVVPLDRGTPRHLIDCPKRTVR